jgi:activator of HSP90 ATPase
MKEIKQRYLIKASLSKVWDALTNPKTIEKWGAGPALMSEEVGFEFSLWGGEVYGKNLFVEELENDGKKLVQEWFGGEWEIPSIVTIILNADDHTTEILLEHRGLPQDEVDEFADGWKEYYFIPIKKLLEK